MNRDMLRAIRDQLYRSERSDDMISRQLRNAIDALLEDGDEPSLRGWVFLEHRGELTPFWAGSGGLYTTDDEDTDPEMTWWEVEGTDATVRPITAADLSVEAYTMEEIRTAAYSTGMSEFTWVHLLNRMRAEREATS